MLLLTGHALAADLLSLAWQYAGQREHGHFGAGLATPGDLDGDGLDEVAIGSHYAGDGEEGAVDVFAGTATGPADTPSVSIDGTSVSGQFGRGLAGVGDVDGDGYADLAVSAPYTGLGRAFVYTGGLDVLAPDRSVELTRADDGFDSFGSAIAGPGDLDGDGRPDIVVTAYGQAWFYTGAALGTADGVAFGPAERSEFFGVHLASAGDTNADGLADIVVASCFDGDADAGAGEPAGAWLFTGGATGPVESAYLAGVGTSRNDAPAVQGVGDVDRDGFDDVAVSDPGTNLVTVLPGREDGLGSALWTGTDPAEDFGLSLAPELDLNGDGGQDLVVGEVAVYLGSAGGLPETPAGWLTSPGRDDLFGYTLASPGDLTGDGVDDLLVSAHYDAGGLGAVYLYAGSSELEPGAPDTGGSDSGGADSAGNDSADPGPGDHGRGGAVGCGCAETPSAPSVGVLLALGLATRSGRSRVIRS